MQNYNQKNNFWSKVPNYDFQINIKNLKHLERNQSLIWQEMVEQYQKKIDYIKKKNIDQYFEKTALKLEIQKIYENQCNIAAEDYESDIREIKKKDIKDQHSKDLQNLQEQIKVVNDFIIVIKDEFKGIPQNKTYKFLIGSSSDYSFVFIYESLINKQLYLTHQKYNHNFYVSNFSQLENLQSVSCISCKDIQSEQVLLAYSNEQTVYFFIIFSDSKQFEKKSIFQKQIKDNIDILQIINQTTIIATNQTKGKVYIIKEDSSQILFYGQEIILECKYLKDLNIIRVLNQFRIVEISDILTAPKYDEHKTEEFKSLLYYEFNLPNFYIQYSRFLQKISEDSIAYINGTNEVKVFNVNEGKDKEFSVPTQSKLELVYFHYFDKLNMAIFCNSDGQTYKIEKLKDLFI